jgi:hypothetical protein
MDRDACYTRAARPHTFVCGRRKWFTHTHGRELAEGGAEPPKAGPI